MTDQDGTAGGESGHGKRVTWAELYFDLVFVFAVGQVAHAIVEDPVWHRVGESLGVFATLWWTWIGFAVLYNRQGDDERPGHRLVQLAGTIPCAIAATQAHHVFEGHPATFALALAGARLVLAGAYTFAAHGVREVRGIGWGYALSVALFAVSAALPAPWCYVLWGSTLLQEGGFLLLGERRAQARAVHDELEQRRGRGAVLRERFAPPRDPHQAVDSGHLAERFGLFMIILLGELVITAGDAALDPTTQNAAYWLSLVGGLVLAGALWWVYFTSAAEIDKQLLAVSGGNPALAYSLYAGGHLAPAFALLLIAAGVNLSLHEHPPHTAPWFIAIGLTIYLTRTRIFSTMSGRRYAAPLRILAIVATANLGQLDRVLSAPAIVAVAAAWAVGGAVIATRSRDGMLQRIQTDPAAFVRGRA